MRKSQAVGRFGRKIYLLVGHAQGNGSVESVQRGSWMGKFPKSIFFPSGRLLNFDLEAAQNYYRMVPFLTCV